MMEGTISHNPEYVQTTDFGYLGMEQPTYATLNPQNQPNKTLQGTFILLYN